jgi:TolB-like protein/DNA-binding winged helix-turn-helix (wHTH) protein/Tfp pilus assembly protein PilF
LENGVSAAAPHSGQEPRCQYFFAGFELDVEKGFLCLNGEEVALRPKAFETLTYLLRNHGRLVTKNELIAAVWPDTAVADNSLTQCIVELRRVLGDDSQHLIRTVARRGYIFAAPVTSPVAEFPQSGAASAIVKSKASVERRKWLLAFIALMSAIATALVALRYFAGSPKGDRATASLAIHSIAVLPLENLSGDPTQDYFAEGVTDALINNLAQIRAVNVISRTSAMRYKGSKKALPEIARELNVDAIVEGTVQRFGGRVRVTANLIRAATDSHLWSHGYESDTSDVLKMETDIARAIAGEIRVQLTTQEQARLASAPEIDPRSHELYLLGRYHLYRANEKDLQEAIRYFERAIQIAPGYAAAYAGLSDAWLRRGFGSKEVESSARAAAVKAVELDEQLAEAHLSLANVKLLYDWDWAGADRENRRALELDPGSLDAHIYRGQLLMMLGRNDEAISEGRTAVRLDPLSSATQAAMGLFLRFAGQYEQAVPYLQRAVELEPRSIQANMRLGRVYAKLGRYDEALSQFKRVQELAPSGAYGLAGIARVYAATGRPREARQMLARLKTAAYDVALAHLALGDREAAFSVLRKAVAEHRETEPLVYRAEPEFAILHSDPRWPALLRPMNFPPAK